MGRRFQNDLINGINTKAAIHEVGQNSLSDSCKKIGYTGADVDRFLGINTSAVNWLAVSDDVSKVEK